MKYIGKKEVEAESMTLGEFIKTSGRDPYANKADMHSGDEPGYVVKYADGYMSWSPKTTFEKAYKVSETYIDRMKIELEEVKERLTKLNNYLFSEKCFTPDRKSFCQLRNQKDAMERYLEILLERIYCAEHPNDVKKEPYAGRCEGTMLPDDDACGVGTCACH